MKYSELKILDLFYWRHLILKFSYCLCHKNGKQLKNACVARFRKSDFCDVKKPYWLRALFFHFLDASKSNYRDWDLLHCLKFFRTWCVYWKLQNSRRKNVISLHVFSYWWNFVFLETTLEWWSTASQLLTTIEKKREAIAIKCCIVKIRCLKLQSIFISVMANAILAYYENHY